MQIRFVRPRYRYRLRAFKLSRIYVATVYRRDGAANTPGRSATDRHCGLIRKLGQNSLVANLSWIRRFFRTACSYGRLVDGSNVGSPIIGNFGSIRGCWILHIASSSRALSLFPFFVEGRLSQLGPPMAEEPLHHCKSSGALMPQTSPPGRAGA